MRKLPIDQLSALFQAIAEKEALYIPADDSSGQARFQRWHEGMEMTHALNTVRSAKDFFFPQTENLVDFKLKGKEIEVNCQFCNKHYKFSVDELGDMLKKATRE